MVKTNLTFNVLCFHFCLFLILQTEPLSKILTARIRYVQQKAVMKGKNSV